MARRLIFRRGFWLIITVSAAGCALSYPTTARLSQDCEGNEIALIPSPRGDTYTETLIVRTPEPGEFILVTRTGEEIGRIRLVQYLGSEMDGPIEP